MDSVENCMNRIWDYANPKDTAEYQVLKRWAESIIDKCGLEMGADEESEIVNELKDML